MSIRTRKARRIWVEGSLLAGLLVSDGLGLFADVLMACPGLLMAEHLPIARRNGNPKRSDLQLFSYQGGSAPWIPLALQLDPLDKEGSLLFPDDKEWLSKALDPRDRLSFAIDGFGKRFDAKSPAPCAHTHWIELEEHGLYAYLLDCNKGSARTFESPVLHDEAQRTVTSPYYKFHYSERNHLVFDEIQINMKGTTDFSAVAGKSDLLILADVKNFFTMIFDAENFDARIVRKRNGPLGLMGGMEFYLKIMAFRIELALMPEVNFFNNALFMPMTMFLPIDAKKYLHRGSGVYYTWESSPETIWLFDESNIGELDLSTIDPDFEGESAKPSPAHCNQDRCRFSLVGKVKGRRFVMDFIISRQAADLGFFPRLIKDVASIEKKLGRSVSRFEKQKRMGIYFESARLPKGTHAWDFWIYFPEKGLECEHTFSVQNVNLVKSSPP